MNPAMKRFKARSLKLKKMKLKRTYLLLAFLSVLTVGAQQKLEKTSKSVKTSKDVTIDLNTSYTDIEIESWDKNSIEVTAYIESSDLDKKELKELLDEWDVEVNGSGDKVSIISKGGSIHGDWNVNFITEATMDALKDLSIDLADLPEIPEMPEMPVMPEMPEMPELNIDMPEMPELPELPELPEGVHNVNFDTKAYEKDGEAYLEKWSQEYEDKYGKEYKEKMKTWAKEFSKIDFDSYSAEMEEWGKKFGEKFTKDYERDMEKWGEEVSKKFDGKWAKEMEEWGEKFGEEFGEEYAERMEKHAAEIEKRMEERAVRLEERHKQREERLEKRSEELEKRLEERVERREELRERMIDLRDGKVKRTIKIKMPKDAKLKVNVRHGELKFASVIYNLNADLTHSSLLATSIDGRNTSINASYSTIFVKNWNEGELDINYVDDAILQVVNALILTSNSSNINIDAIVGNATIDGSFGDLTIHNIKDSFNELNIILENSEAYVSLPKTNYKLKYEGTRSRLKHPEKKSNDNTSSFSSGNLNSDKSILINAKYCNVIMQ
jgi:hypothetical protein